MEEILQIFLRLYPLLSPEAQQYVMNALKTKEVKKKTLLLKIDQVCKNIYFIEKGLFRCYYYNGEKEVCSWFKKEGDFIISVNSFFDQKPSYEAIEAVEDGVLQYISFMELQYICLHFLEFNIIRALILEKYYKELDAIMYATKMKTAHERYKFLRDTYPEIVLRVPATYIASFLGISLETLSRIKSRR